jgi:putative MATE family efflux protein
MANSILETKTNKALIVMSIPISLGMLSTFLFQVIDTYFVGQLGARELAALSFASTIYFMVVGAFIGLAVGVSIMVGKFAGAGDKIKLKEVLFIGILLSLVTTTLLSVLLIRYNDSVFLALGSSETLIPYIKEYMTTLLWGMPLLTFGLMAGANLRANGNIVMPDVIMGIAGIINLVFDYLLIFGKLGFTAYGIKGAAMATVWSWVFVAIAMFVYLIKDALLSIDSFKAFKRAFFYTKKIVTFGIPVVITQIIQPFTLMFITFLLAKKSVMAVAAYGVAGRIEMLVLIAISGVSMAITPFIAQNLGARNKERIDQAIAFGGRTSTYIGLLVCVGLFVFGEFIAGIFTDDSSIITDTISYFHWVSPSYIFYGLFIITTSILNGLQQPLKSLKIMLVKTLAFTIPFALLGSIMGVKGIFIGLSVSNVLGGFYAAYIMKKDLKSAQSDLATVNIFSEYKKDLMNLVRRKKED